MKSIKDTNFYNSRVFVRCDFNVPIKKGKVLENFRIERCLETIKYLKKSGAKIILASHFGNPFETKSKRKRKKLYSLKPVKQVLEELLREKIKFSKKITGKKLEMRTRRMKPGQIMLLENLRFDKREEKNESKFAKKLSQLADSYVNEAFAACHRKHASIVALPKLLPHFAGFNLKEEVEILSKIIQNPERPLCVIIGGIKIDSKIKVIEKFLGISDYLLVGGRIATNILRVKGICIGKPWPKEPVVRVINKINLTDSKIHLPIDVLASPNIDGDIYVRETGPGSVRNEEENLDIGGETIKKFSDIIKNSKTIFWSGPLGYFENEKFSQGTKKIAEAIGDCSNAFKIVGGGETIEAINKFNLSHKFSFISTGGGAMLSFLIGDEMPGIEALE